MKLPSVYDFKQGFSKVLMPVIKPLVAAGLRANHVTVLACAMSIAYGLLVMLHPESMLLLAGYPLVLFVRMALNNIDGVMAVQFGQQTKLGGDLNEQCDVVSDAGLYLPLAYVAGFHPVLVVVLVLLAALVELAGVHSYRERGVRCYLGPFGKSDRALFFGAIGLLAGLTLIGSPVLSGILAIVLLLSALLLIKFRPLALILIVLAGNLLVLNVFFAEQFINGLLIEACVLSCVTLYRRVKFNITEEK